MSLSISQDLLTRIETTCFKRKEVKTLQSFKNIIFNGAFQMGSVKKELFTLNTNMQMENSEISSIINQQKSKLQIFNNELNILQQDISESTQKALSIVKQCEENLNELSVEYYNKLIHSVTLLKKLIELLEEAAVVEDYDKRADIILDNSITFFKKFVSDSKIAYMVGTVIGFALVPVILLTVPAAILPMFSLCSSGVSIASGGTYAAIFKRVKNYVNNCFALKAEVRTLAKKLIEEIEIAEKEMSSIIKELEKVKKAHKNESKKPEIFRDAMSFVSDFQVIVRRWQEPLIRVNNVFEKYRPPPACLERFVERENENIKFKINKAVIEALDIFYMFEAPQPTITFKINEETISESSWEILKLTKEMEGCVLRKV